MSENRAGPGDEGGLAPVFVLVHEQGFVFLQVDDGPADRMFWSLVGDLLKLSFIYFFH